ncbi:hypothetical protein [Vibrio phage BONAISHI]|nr:hypothetical protein [Vibrio phage BONAISHI]
MLNVSEMDALRIKDLYMRVEAVEPSGLKVKDFLDFVSLRKLIFNVSFDRRSEFEIIKLLACKMAKQPVPYRPRLLVEFDYDKLNPLEKRDLQNSLRDCFDDLSGNYDISFNSLGNKIDDLMPANSQEDISFGIEALYCLLSVSEGTNRMKVFKGPNQSGEIDEDNVE